MFEEKVAEKDEDKDEDAAVSENKGEEVMKKLRSTRAFGARALVFEHPCLWLHAVMRLVEFSLVSGDWQVVCAAIGFPACGAFSSVICDFF